MTSRLTTLFIRSAGAILLAAALIRFLIAAGDAQVLALADPLLGIPLRYAVLLVGIAELAVAGICLFGKNPGLQLSWVAWLSFNCVIVRIGLYWMNVHVQGTCLGSLTDPLQIAQGIPGLLAQILPILLLIGSGSLLFRSWRTASKARKAGQNTSRQPEADYARMTCSSCGGHIAFSVKNLGQAIPCPHCKASITLRRDKSLKMSCAACQGHIEFPAHALGRILQCPHCRMDITLKEPATP